MTPEDAVGVPWLAGLLPVPPDAAWPRLLSAPSPRAVGSHGEQFVGLGRRARPLAVAVVAGARGGAAARASTPPASWCTGSPR